MVVIIGGIVLKTFESGEITEGETPFWWAIVTMTTVGYGDFVPKSPQGRIFAVFVMFAGISLVSLLTASISSIFVAKKIREGKGLEKVDLKAHIVFCGWNRNGEQILDSIQYLSGDKKSDIVLINDLNEDDINSLKNKFRDLKIYYVAGDFTNERILDRASIRSADTVVIIPNQTDSAITSPDEKTIFATLTIKSIDPKIRVIAYLNERENLKHIRRANVDEVVLSDDFGAFMVASHVVNPGVPQTLNSLVNNRSKNRFLRVPIPHEFVGRSYDELFTWFRENKHWVLIGVFSEDESLGIGEILSADTSALDAFIERKLKEGGISLQEESKVKTVINPSGEYTIKPNERAIVIP
ncbi:MAG: potassium channel family protein [Fidelibacterota bacterium]